MNETNDYEKAKQECWKKYASAFDIQGSIPNEAFNWVFKQGYQLGTAHAQLANGLANERLQVAAMAMQGILSNAELSGALCKLSQKTHDVTKFYEGVADGAVRLADALLTELNKPKDELEKH